MWFNDLSLIVFFSIILTSLSHIISFQCQYAYNATVETDQVFCRNSSANANDWHLLQYHINMWFNDLLFIVFFKIILTSLSHIISFQCQYAYNVIVETNQVFCRNSNANANNWHSLNIISICELRTCYSDKSNSLMHFQFECKRLTFIEASYQYAN
jgi:cell division protein FtsL